MNDFGSRVVGGGGSLADYDIYMGWTNGWMD